MSKAKKPSTSAQIAKLRDDVDNLKARLDTHIGLQGLTHASAEDVKSLTSRVEELTRTIGQIAEVAASPSWVAGVDEALVDAAKRLREVEGRSHEESGILSATEARRLELNTAHRRLAAVERRTFWQWLWGAR